MKFQAIVINEKGAFAHLNGHTFAANEVTAMADLAVDRVVLLTPGPGGIPVHVDFKFKNVLIVNAAEVAQSLYDGANWYGDSSLAGRPLSALNGLKRWAEIHKVVLSPTYNMTA